MREKHRDCTDEWDKKQQALKKIYLENSSSHKVKETKKDHH